MVALPRWVLWGPEQNKKAEESSNSLSAWMLSWGMDPLLASMLQRALILRPLDWVRPWLSGCQTFKTHRCSLCASSLQTADYGTSQPLYPQDPILMINLSISEHWQRQPKMEKIAMACFTLTVRVAGQELCPSSSGSKSPGSHHDAVWWANVHCIPRTWGPRLVSRASHPHSPHEHCLPSSSRQLGVLRPLGIKTFPSRANLHNFCTNNLPFHCENSLSVQQPLKFLISGLKWVKCHWQAAH